MKARMWSRPSDSALVTVGSCLGIAPGVPFATPIAQVLTRGWCEEQLALVLPRAQRTREDHLRRRLCVFCIAPTRVRLRHAQCEAAHHPSAPPRLTSHQTLYF